MIKILCLVCEIWAWRWRVKKLYVDVHYVKLHEIYLQYFSRLNPEQWLMNNTLIIRNCHSYHICMSFPRYKLCSVFIIQITKYQLYLHVHAMAVKITAYSYNWFKWNFMSRCTPYSILNFFDQYLCYGRPIIVKEVHISTSISDLNVLDQDNTQWYCTLISLF